jgi:hypothetical protein
VTITREVMNIVPKEANIKSTPTAQDRKGGMKGAPKSRKAREARKNPAIAKIKFGYR